MPSIARAVSKGISDIVVTALLITATVVLAVIAASIIYPGLGLFTESTISIRVAGYSSYYLKTNPVYIYGKFISAPSNPVYLNTVSIIVTNKYRSPIDVSIDGTLYGISSSYASWSNIITGSGLVYIYNDAGICSPTPPNKITVDPDRSVVIVVCIVTAGSELPKGIAALRIICTGCDKNEYFIKI